MTATTEILTVPEQQPVPSAGQLLDIVRRWNYHEAALWTPHYDNQDQELASGGAVFEWRQARDTDEWLKDLESMRAAEGHYDTVQYPWLPERQSVPGYAVNVAESIRRRLSPDAAMLADALPPQEGDRPADRLPDVKRQLQLERATDRAKLLGQHTSTARNRLHRAEASGDHRELVPLTSRRVYREISLDDVAALETEADGTLVQLAADMLSPVRDEHLPMRPEVLERLASEVAARRAAIGGFAELLLTNCWRLAQRRGQTEQAGRISGLLDAGSALRSYLESYESVQATKPDTELMQRNAERFTSEYLAAGGDTEALKGEQADSPPHIRLRLKPEALWSIAMRDDGYIRTGAEGTIRDTGRGYEGHYAAIRRQVETVLYGPAATDVVADEPIIYGYYASDSRTRTPAMQSLGRIYGGVELVFKADIHVDKRVVYGDSMNAIALAAAESAASGRADAALIRSVLESRVISEADAPAMAKVIDFLHGQDENTQFNPSANPYIECLMRGRLNLSDCAQIRIAASTYDANLPLMDAIAGRYSVDVVSVE